MNRYGTFEHCGTITNKPQMGELVYHFNDDDDDDDDDGFRSKVTEDDKTKTEIVYVSLMENLRMIYN